MEQQAALNRYEQTWARFAEELKSNPRITLRAVCRMTHTNSDAMGKWMSRKGYSVAMAKASASQPDNGQSSSFAPLVAREESSTCRTSLLNGISITFNSGTVVNIRQGDADGIIRLIGLYERKDGELCFP